MKIPNTIAASALSLALLLVTGCGGANASAANVKDLPERITIRECLNALREASIHFSEDTRFPRWGQSAGGLRPDDSLRIRLGESDITVAIGQFTNSEQAIAFAWNLHRSQMTIVFRNLVIVCLETSSSLNWERLQERLLAAGGTTNFKSAVIPAKDVSDEAAVLIHNHYLAMLSIIELFRVEHRSSPWRDAHDVNQNQWEPLLVGGYLRTNPTNPLSPQDRGSKLVGVDDPEATGIWISPKGAGWVWNTATQQLYPAGCSDNLFEVTLQPRAGRLPLLPRKLDWIIASFEISNQRLPWPDQTPSWSQLVEHDYLDSAPVNPLSPSSVASKIFFTRDPAMTGAELDPNTAGWLWNDEWHTIFAAGVDNEGRLVEHH